jgi:peptide/nickel transport system ATP-binding protein
MIAMALSCSPQVLIADEPTTALDVTIQAQILAEIEDLRAETGVGILLITHDLGVIAEVADRVAVMYAGRVVEQGDLRSIFNDPLHPYTWGCSDRFLGSTGTVPDDCQPSPVPPLDAKPAARLPFHSPLPASLRPLRRGALFGGLRPRPTVASGPVLAGPGRQARRADGQRHHRTTGPGGSPVTADGASAPLLEIDHLQVLFPVRAGMLGRTRAHVHAVDDVTLSLSEGETLGLVGESGCGKTTLARTVLRLTQPTAGHLRFRGDDITGLGQRRLRPFRSEVQMVFQDPQASLNPRKRVGQIVGAGLALRGVSRQDRPARVRELLAQVGLNPEHVNRFPHEFSGGQRQRVGVARALAAQPRLIVLDEPVSALDVSIQAQVVNLLDHLQDTLGLSYIFVAHDLSVVRHVSHRIAVMYLGKIVEVSPAEELYRRPIHPYTVALLDAVPIPDAKRSKRRRAPVQGDPPSATDPPPGCRFAGRCPHATEVCTSVEPPLVAYPGGHLAACHHPRNVNAAELAAASISPTSPFDAGTLLPEASSVVDANATTRGSQGE